MQREEIAKIFDRVSVKLTFLRSCEKAMLVEVAETSLTCGQYKLYKGVYSICIKQNGSVITQRIANILDIFTCLKQNG